MTRYYISGDHAGTGGGYCGSRRDDEPGARSRSPRKGPGGTGGGRDWRQIKGGNPDDDATTRRRIRG